MKTDEMKTDETKTKTKTKTYQVLVDTFVQLPLLRPALPQLLVVVLEALPMRAERLEAACVDVLDACLVSGFWARRGSVTTYTLRAHRVTLRPSFRHSTSPRPGFSALHCM